MGDDGNFNLYYLGSRGGYIHDIFPQRYVVIRYVLGETLL